MRTTLARSGLLVLTPLLLVASTPGSSGQEEIRLDRFAEARPGDGIAAGWSLRAVRGERPPSTRLEVVDGALALIMAADSAAGQAWLELDEPIDPDDGTLSWEWSLTARPDGIRLGVPEVDDSAGRFFVVFGGRGLFRRPRVLFYSWGQDEELEEAFRSYVSDRAGVIVVRNAAAPNGTWYRERRDPAADFRRVFGRDPDEIRALGLMADTDQLGGRAEVRLRSVGWSPHRPGDADTPPVGGS